LGHGVKGGEQEVLKRGLRNAFYTPEIKLSTIIMMLKAGKKKHQESEWPGVLNIIPNFY